MRPSDDIEAAENDDGAGSSYKWPAGSEASTPSPSRSGLCSTTNDLRRQCISRNAFRTRALAPLEVCASSAEQLSPGSRFLALRLLGQQQPKTLYFLVDAKSRVREVYTQTCLHFATQGMQDTELFGLAVLIDGEYMFADPESKLSKYGPKSWRSSHTHGLDANGRPLLELHFRVQFYIESPYMLKDETSRHNYYLQLRHNVLQRELPREHADQALILLAGLALQADLGDAKQREQEREQEREREREQEKRTLQTLPKIRKRLSSYNERSSDYFRLEDYLPATLQTTAWAKSAVRACHQEHQGLGTMAAQLAYIEQACSLNEIINAHTYRMRLNKNEMGAGSAWFVIYARGIKILDSAATETANFLWPNITKLSFERKKFEIRSGENRITLYAATDEKNKLLLSLCKDTHQWSMKLAARLKEINKREQQEQEREREQETESSHAEVFYTRSLLLPYKSKNEQRISVISSTSSNTTSGIVSDRVHSEDELEIMINTPPAAALAAPSTESLALAHLLDNRPSVSRQTSLSLKDLEEKLAAMRPNNKLSNDSSTANDSPGSQHQIGSQCSSTCSTVVVTTPPPAAPSTPATPAAPLHSTCSSLELGFSHTAQNSAADDFLPSGVYNLAPPTETSGVYTMHSSELTGQSSELAESVKSSHYGSFKPSSNKSVEHDDDAVDGAGQEDNNKSGDDFRLRSDSNLSTSSSFRGDGSDPTDNQHSLLSADELTNLIIVGRGTYPSRKIISSSLHTASDYVELPLVQPELPPAPPPPYSARHEKTGLCGPPVPKSKPELPPVAAPPPTTTTTTTTTVAAPPVLATPPPPRRRDPPPYPSAQHKPRPTSLISLPVAGSRSEEVTARFITTRPQISILKAHTSLLPDGAKPSYAAPTHYSSSSGSVCSHQFQSQQSLHNSNYAGGSQASLQHHGHGHHGGSQASLHHQHHPGHVHGHGHGLGHPHGHHQHHHHHGVHHRHSGSAAIGIPLVPYGLHHKSSASSSCVLLPVIKPRQFLPPPPPSLPRQPPPPPPPALHRNHQLELYQQQLYSDVDYVIYPLQDPAVSQQEYLDAKYLAAQATNPGYLAYPGWDHCKGHAIYRSTPYLPAFSRYASTQNLSDTYVQLSPLYSPSMASLCSSFEPPPPPPLHPAAALAHAHAAAAAAAAAASSASASASASASSSLFARSRSDDNILNSLDSLPRMPKAMPMPMPMKRLPPPPPPPYVNRLKKPPMPTPTPTSLPMSMPIPAPSEQPPPIPSKPNSSSNSNSCSNSNATVAVSMLPPRKPLTLNPHSANSPLIKTSSGAQWAGERPKPDLGLGLNRGNSSNSILAQLQASVAASQAAAAAAAAAANSTTANPLDIASLREKSKHLDLPLISALCNDRSLLKQTKVMVNSKQAAAATTTTGITTTTTATTATATTSSNGNGIGNTCTLSKARNGGKSATTATISHRHPQDKLPPLPVQQLAEANNYVMDPALLLKHHHKSYNSQSHSHSHSQSQTQTQSQSQSQS
ncbi:hypothetical protein ACLKA7_004759 [Drosophila subpalustris]